MSETRVTVDISQVQAAFDFLTPEKLRTATRSAFNAASGILQRSAQKEYRAMFPGSIIYKDIHKKAYRSGKGAMVDLIYVKKHAKSYILPMLEQGNFETRPRVTKDGKNRGNIFGGKDYRQPSWESNGARFFSRGVDSSINRAQDKLQTNITKQIIKQAQKAGFETRGSV